ncbi:glycerate kinase [Bacillus sp. FJAT-42376]|uniref:glycerate kinase family protein n=1 Tax=Bacillus sp. FJAT-42376 TaxID=2014076 RepID=UPI000F4D649F|nr:glycerate kinase [Bacillus sp. FJAT-42376]AZB41454.1 glycerate kinase [Bacillus sp. FJAT-42376]
MNIVIAPDSFKESMTASEAAGAFSKGFKKKWPDANVIEIPIADGGEGMVKAIVHSSNGVLIEKTVTGPLSTPVKAVYGLIDEGKTAVIEMAEASGLHLVPPASRNPLHTTTKGTGELIKDAASKGVKKIILGIGGSATNDGGAGMAQALGIRLLNSEGDSIQPGGGGLRDLSSIEISGVLPELKDIEIIAACDVDNPLTGEKGASAVFGPQKGATPEMVKELDQNLLHLSSIISRDVGIEVKNCPGSGAAGGLGAGLMAFLDAKLERGIELVLDAIHFDRLIAGADLVITGEGKIDGQTMYGKTPMGAAKRALKQNIPVIGVAGTLGNRSDILLEKGFTSLFSISPGAISLEQALADGPKNMEQFAYSLAGILQLKKNG